jgi:hypothetical protein
MARQDTGNTVEFFGVWTTDDEMTGSIKTFCKTREIAGRELLKYRDFFSSEPPKPDDKHIRKFIMIVS